MYFAELSHSTDFILRPSLIAVLHFWQLENNAEQINVQWRNNNTLSAWNPPYKYSKTCKNSDHLEATALVFEEGGLNTKAKPLFGLQGWEELDLKSRNFAKNSKNQS